MTIKRILTRASLDDPEPALERARREARSGDESWEQWLAEYDRGEAVIVRLDVVLEADDGQPRTVEVANTGVFIEADGHPPKVERQISELVSKDFSTLADELSKLGCQLDGDELCDMYVHVELADDLQGTLRRSGARRGSRRITDLSGDAGVSDHHGPAAR